MSVSFTAQQLNALLTYQVPQKEDVRQIHVTNTGERGDEIRATFDAGYGQLTVDIEPMGDVRLAPMGSTVAPFDAKRTVDPDGSVWRKAFQA